MAVRVVVGTQWGDEGKGKIIDILASRADVVIRSQGGNNAGHTVESAGNVYKLHLIPSGILYPETLCLIGCGVVVGSQGDSGGNRFARVEGVSCQNLRIDPRAHVIMPWNIAIDGLSEKARGGSDIGTTLRGIGPCYMDKMERVGLRMCDLTDEEVFSRKARQTGALRKPDAITRLYGAQPLDLDAILAEYAAYGRRLRQYMADTSAAWLMPPSQRANRSCSRARRACCWISTWAPIPT